MQVKAVRKFLKVTPRKVRLVANLVRGLDVDKAQTTLRFTTKACSQDVEQLLRSAVANATHNFKLDQKNLFVKEIFVGPGPMLKRFMPRSQGRAFRILKHSSHVTVILDERTPKKVTKGEKAAKERKAPEVKQVLTREEIKQAQPKKLDGKTLDAQEAKNASIKPSVAQKKRLFRRKGGM